MASIMNIRRCGGCHFGKFIAQDITKRMCWGAPPSSMMVPGPGNAPSLRMARPVVNAADDACALYQQREDTDRDEDDLGLTANDVKQ
jgi:hypothetical protein